MKQLRLFAFIVIILIMLGSSSFAETKFSDSPDAIEEAALSIVRLTTYDDDGNPMTQGSGFLIFDNITLVTNYHVIEGASVITADSDDNYQYFVTKILIASEEKDLAILRFMAPTVMQPLKLSEDTLKRGEKVVAIGSPKGLKNSVSFGNISNVYFEDNIYWLQFTAPISNGSSGGALFNEAGKVIGITSASFETGQNINLAISIIDVLNLWQRWDGKVYDIADTSLALVDKTSILSPTPAPTKVATPSPNTAVKPTNTPLPNTIPRKTNPTTKPKNLPSKIHLMIVVGESVNLKDKYANNLYQNLLLYPPFDFSQKLMDTIEIIWDSSDNKGLRVNQKGIITANSHGSYTVTARTPGGKSVTFYITVIRK